MRRQQKSDCILMYSSCVVFHLHKVRLFFSSLGDGEGYYYCFFGLVSQVAGIMISWDSLDHESFFASLLLSVAGYDFCTAPGSLFWFCVERAPSPGPPRLKRQRETSEAFSIRTR
jgi:hypothetical protein